MGRGAGSTALAAKLGVHDRSSRTVAALPTKSGLAVIALETHVDFAPACHAVARVVRMRAQCAAVLLPAREGLLKCV